MLYLFWVWHQNGMVGIFVIFYNRRICSAITFKGLGESFPLMWLLVYNENVPYKWKSTNCEVLDPKTHQLQCE